MTSTTETLPAETGGTDITRFNALRHGVLSRYDRRFAIGRRIKELTLTFRERLSLDADSDPLPPEWRSGG